MRVVNMHEAKTQLSRLVDSAVAGEEVVIGKAGRPLVRLVPVENERKPRELGWLRGQIWVADDFEDDLPEELMKYFRGEMP